MGLLRRNRERKMAEERERAAAAASADFAAKKAEAVRTGGMVCGTYKPNGQPVYWVQAPSTPDEVIEAQAFKAREGRALSEGEVMLKAAAEAVKARA